LINLASSEDNQIASIAISTDWLTRGNSACLLRRFLFFKDRCVAKILSR
jgi:hypothetical protein